MGKLPISDEIPLPVIPREPYWSENYYFVGSDSVRGVSIVCHIGRWSKDPNFWREQVLIFLPDGTFALSQNIGVRPSENGPAGALLSLRCEEAGARWRLCYRGPTRRTTNDELFSGRPLTVVPDQLIDVDLVFEGQTEIWDFGRALSGESWASFHYEQSGRLCGRIEIDDHLMEVDAVAHRDHSRGPRRYSGIETGIWMQGHFPDGRSFALIDSKWTGKDRHAMARVFQGGRIYDAVCSPVPTIEAYDALPKSFALKLESELGVMEVIGELVKGLPQGFDDRHEVLYGSATFPGITAMSVIVGPTKLRWNGLEGVGHVDFCWGPKFDS